MKFRPCIDIHNGKVKQIVGSSLKEEGSISTSNDNFVSQKDADYYARLYKEKGLCGGHVILLNKPGDDLFHETKRQALLALLAYPGGLQIGGGINDENAREYLQAGASHVIVTSYVFSDGIINMDRLKRISNIAGKDKLVLDLSVKVQPDGYHIATDRWQKVSDERLDEELMERLSGYCDEFLIHATDVEGKKNGVDESLLEILSKWNKLPITYAGGIKGIEDIDIIYQSGRGYIDYTIGSALDIFGGNIPLEEVCAYGRAN